MRSPAAAPSIAGRCVEQIGTAQVSAIVTEEPDARPLDLDGTVDDESELRQWTVDGSFEFGGGTLYAAVVGNHIENSTVERDEFGFLIQGGLFLNEDWELMARYEWGDLDGAGTVSDDPSIVTPGVSRFFNRQGLKFTADVGYAFNEMDGAWGGASRGWRTDAIDEEGQLVLRTRLHLLF
ncbi:MAG: hypothetical protein SYC29_09700 [Planctomycetota bacterium]|nr:hypothetical protein [Planctomycetota bacterium]